MKLKMSMVLTLAVMLAASGSAFAWTSVGITDAIPTYWACAATDGYKVYHVGGLDTAGNPMTTLQIYDPATDSWAAGTAPGTGVFCCVADYWDGLIYVAGGFVDNAFNGTSLLQIYDPATDTWSNGANMPDARGGLVGGIIDGKLYTVGGQPTSSFATDNPTYAYDIATDTWDNTLAAAPMNGGGYGQGLGAGVAVQGILYQGGHFVAYDDFDYYDPATDTWTSGPAIPAAAGKMTPLFVNGGGVLYNIGGGSALWTATTAVYTYTPDVDGWAPYASSLATANIGTSGALVGDTIYSYGGTIGSYALNPPPHEAEVVLTIASVTLDPAAPGEVLPGDTIQFTAIVDDGAKTAIPDLKVKFASSNETVGVINPDLGLFEALADGETDITASYAGVDSDAATVVVNSGGDDDDDDDDDTGDDDTGDDDTGDDDDDDDDDDSCGCRLF